MTLAFDWHLDGVNCGAQGWVNPWTRQLDTGWDMIYTSIESTMMPQSCSVCFGDGLAAPMGERISSSRMIAQCEGRLDIPMA